MLKPYSLQNALIKYIEGVEAPAITKYDLSIFIYKLYKEKNFKGSPVRLVKDTPSAVDINVAINKLLSIGIIYSKSNTAKDSYYNISGRKGTSISEVCCAIDPCCYVSHASAMEHYGLTDRNFKYLTLTTLSIASFKQQKSVMMRNDLGGYYDDYMRSKLRKLTLIHLKAINRTPVRISKKMQLGSNKQSNELTARFSTIGRTFLDMLKEPELCGGFDHVYISFKNNATRYLKMIIKEFDSCGNDTDKVRCGYILEEVLGIHNNNTIDSWKQLRQRGGSRKLDHQRPYSQIFSETWDLSINIGDTDE